MKLVRFVLFLLTLSLSCFQTQANIIIARDSYWNVTGGTARAPFGTNYTTDIVSPAIHTFWNSDIWLTNSFSTNAYDPNNITFSYAIDDSADVWINGNLLSTPIQIPFSAPQTIPIAYLVNGANTVVAHIVGNGTWDYFSLEISGVGYIIPGPGGPGVGCEPPVIDHNPSGTTVTVGDDAVFQVFASGPSLTYQWYSNSTALTDGSSCNGSSIAGATTSILTIQSAQLCNAASYHCVVANSCDTNTSSSVILKVLPTLCANVQFGYPVTTKTGAAYTGASGDFWNVVHGHDRDEDVSCDEGNWTYDTIYDPSDTVAVGTVITSYPYDGTSFSCGDPPVGSGGSSPFTDVLFNSFLVTWAGADFELMFNLPPGTYDFIFYCQLNSYPLTYGDKTAFSQVTLNGTVVNYEVATGKYSSSFPYERYRNFVYLPDVVVDSSGYAYFIVSDYIPGSGWFGSNPIVNGVQIVRHNRGL